MGDRSNAAKKRKTTSQRQGNFEGEEEIGSPHLEKFMAANKDLLKTDYALADALQKVILNPEMGMSVRGLPLWNSL